MRGEQFLLLPVDLPARLDLYLRRPRRPLGLAPPCARTVQKGAPILANQPHVHGRRAHLSLCVAQVRQHPIDLELERDRIELRQRGSRGDDHVVVRIQRNNLAADIRGNGGDVPHDISVGRPHLEHVPDPPAEHDARRAQQEPQGSGQPECAAPARGADGRRPASLSSGASPGWAGRNGSLAPPAIRTPFRHAPRNRNPPFSSTGPSWKPVGKGEHQRRGTVETNLKPAPNPALEPMTPQTTHCQVGFQHAPTAGFPHCYLFNQTLGVRTPSLSARRTVCNEEKSHDDRFFLGSYAAGVESRKTETRSNSGIMRTIGLWRRRPW